MRRLILEMDVEDVAPFMDEVEVDKVDLMEVLNFLNEDSNDFALIGRVRFKDPSARFSSVIHDRNAALHVISKEKDGSYIFFMRSKHASREDGSPDSKTALTSFGLLHLGGYFSRPFEIREGKVKVTFIGQSKGVRAFLKAMDKSGIKYRIDLLTDARFSADSPMSRLTDKQREALVTAYNLGYYDIPRKIDCDELAERLKVKNPTFVMHRRKAERVILGELLANA